MAQQSKYYKENETDKIWWVETENLGEYLFSFDKKTDFNLFRDYPFKLTAEQKELFDKENPHWMEFFKDRTK